MSFGVFVNRIDNNRIDGTMLDICPSLQLIVGSIIDADSDLLRCHSAIMISCPSRPEYPNTQTLGGTRFAFRKSIFKTNPLKFGNMRG